MVFALAVTLTLTQADLGSPQITALLGKLATPFAAEAARKLYFGGPPARKALLGTMETGQPATQKNVLRFLVANGKFATVPPIQLAQSPDQETRRLALTLLFDHIDKSAVARILFDSLEAVPIAASILRHGQPHQRNRAAWYLTGQNKVDVVQYLLEAMRDPFRNVRVAAVNGLGNFYDRRCRAALALALTDSDWQVRQNAISIFERHSSDAPADVMLTLINDPELRVRQAAGGFYRHASDPRAVPLLEASYRNDLNVRDYAGPAIWRQFFEPRSRVNAKEVLLRNKIPFRNVDMDLGRIDDATLVHLGDVLCGNMDTGLNWYLESFLGDTYRRTEVQRNVAIRVFATLLTSTDAATRQAAVSSMSWATNYDTKQLLPFIRGARVESKILFVRVLRNHYGPGLAEVVAELASDEDSSVRREAIQVLADQADFFAGNDEFRTELEKTPQVAEEVWKSYMRSGGMPGYAVSNLLRLKTRSADSVVREALTRRGTEGWELAQVITQINIANRAEFAPDLIVHMNDEDSAVRYSAVSAYCRLVPRDAARFAESLLYNPLARMRAAGVSYYGGRPNLIRDGIENRILLLAADPDPVVRVSVARDLRLPRLHSRLEPLLSDADVEVRKAAVVAMCGSGWVTREAEWLARRLTIETDAEIRKHILSALSSRLPIRSIQILVAEVERADPATAPLARRLLALTVRRFTYPMLRSATIRP